MRKGGDGPIFRTLGKLLARAPSVPAVKVTFTHNREEYTLLFSSGFDIGTGRVFDIVDVDDDRA